MAATPEKKVKDAVVKTLRARGVYYFFPVASGYGNAGIPDIVCCVSGRFLGIECKAGNNTPTALQLREGKRIEASGGKFMVVNEKNIAQLSLVLSLLESEKE